MSELKPCPFCGGRAIMKIQKHIPNGYDYTPTCQDPSCAGRLTKKWTNETVAIEAWNKRMSGSAEKSSIVERTAKVEEVEKPNVFKCSGCGQYFHSTAWGSPVTYCSRCGAKLDWNEDIPMEYFESGGK